MKILIAVALVLGFVGFGSVRELSAQATVSSFMLVPGIKGESKDAKHKDWIDLISISETLDQVTKRKTACEVQVTKFLDSSWTVAVGCSGHWTGLSSSSNRGPENECYSADCLSDPDD